MFLLTDRSFGVLLWEIVTYGQTPLSDTSVEDIVDAAQNSALCHARLKKSVTMSCYFSITIYLSLHYRPPNCSDYLYQVMSECLKHNYDDRPGFKDIVFYLSNS